MKAYSIRSGSLHHWIKGAIKATSLKEADVVLLPGGADIDSSWYGERPGSCTGGRKEWDYLEVAGFREAVGRGIPIIGICRGEQLACALSGGRLIQDMRHPSPHEITTWDGKTFPVNSLHHQSAYPYDMNNKEYKLLGWADNLSPYHLDGNDNEICEGPIKEVEAIYFTKTNALGFQFHPEMMYPDRYGDALKWCNEQVIRLLAKDFAA